MENSDADDCRRQRFHGGQDRCPARFHMLQAHRIEAKGQRRRHQAEKGEEEARIGHGGGQGKDHAEMAERQEP